MIPNYVSVAAFAIVLVISFLDLIFFLDRTLAVALATVGLLLYQLRSKAKPGRQSALVTYDPHHNLARCQTHV